MDSVIKEDSKLEHELIRCITESFFAAGSFSEEDIKDKESHLFALQRIVDNGLIGGMTVSHTENLTNKAREFKKSNEFDYSRMFYATFFEHQINEIIHLYCVRNQIDNKTQTSIIQSVNIWGKFTWLLKLMNFPSFNKTHLNTIKNLADTRNSFVHYKWKDDSDFDNCKSEAEKQALIENEFEKIEKAVKYFRNYCSKIKFKGNKGKIKQLLK